MHWLWRALIAVVVACILGGLSAALYFDVQVEIIEAIDRLLGGHLPSGPPGGWEFGVAFAITWYAPSAVVGLALFGLLTRLYGPRARSDGETRCRKCGYILKGITEPRCSECGERI